MIVVQPPKHNEIRSLYNAIFVIRNVKKLSYLGFRVVWCESIMVVKGTVSRDFLFLTIGFQTYCAFYFLDVNDTSRKLVGGTVNTINKF
jgi:hypothetical protein